MPDRTCACGKLNTLISFKTYKWPDGSLHSTAGCVGVLGSTRAAGVKADGEKSRPDLLPLKALQDVIDVLGYGAKKYSADNWKKVPDARRRYYAACLRHVFAWWQGEERDPESGLPHLAHACCCLLFILEGFSSEEKTTQG